MKIGPINGLVLIGGGDILLELCGWAKNSGLKLRVISSKRHADEILSDSKTLRSNLLINKIQFLEIEDLGSPKVINFLKSCDDNWLYLSISAAWIFKEQDIQSTFKNQLLNVHGTRLPTNRGGGDSLGKS